MAHVANARGGRPVFNIGSDQPIAIRDLAAAVIAACGSKSTIQFQTYADAYDKDFEDIRRRVPDLCAGCGPRSAISHEAI